jgi:hypothetical protein
MTVAQEVKNSRSKAFREVVDNHESGNASTINWKLGNKQKITLTGSPNCTLTFINSYGPANMNLELFQGPGGSKTISWPILVVWPNKSAAPMLSTIEGDEDLVCLYWNGSRYLCALAAY